MAEEYLLCRVEAFVNRLYRSLLLFFTASAERVEIELDSMFVEIDSESEDKIEEDFILVNSIYCDASDSDPDSFNSDSDISYNDIDDLPWSF